MPILVADRTLLESFRRGEAWAIIRVYQAYVGQVAALLHRGFSFMSGSQSIHFRGFSDAWELECAVQDTFIQAFSPSARMAYDGLKPFGPYLLTIAKNRVISTLRSEQREKRRLAGLLAEGPQPPAPDPEQQALHNELVSLVAAFLDTLPEAERALYELRFVEDLTLLEASRRLGLSRMQARTREQHLRDRFAAFLRQRGYIGKTGKAKAGLLTRLVLP